MTTIRVFIIDDSAIMRAIIARLLEIAPGYEVVGCSENAEEGSEAIAASRPDVVTLDICMPGIDGLHYLEELRSTLHPAMVVVSASTTRGSITEAEALSRGADACFDKARIVSDSALFVETLKAAVLRHERAAAPGVAPIQSASSGKRP